MLNAGTNSVFLESPDVSCGKSAREIRILGKVLKVSAAHNVSFNINARGKQKVGSVIKALRCNKRAAFIAGILVKGGGKGARCGHTHGFYYLVLLRKPIFQGLAKSAWSVIENDNAIGVTIACDLPGRKPGQIFISLKSFFFFHTL